MTQPELKPCPFCGGKPLASANGTALCRGCAFHLTPDLWNRRAPALSPEDLEAIKKVRDEMAYEKSLLIGPGADLYDATLATLFGGWGTALSALIEKWEAK